MTQAATITLILLLAVARASAADGSEVLYVGHLDRDSHADTIVGAPTGDLRMLATAIHWGAPYSSNGDSPGAQTTLIYPQWSGLAGSFAVEDINADRVDDLLLFFNAAPPHARDSARAIALLGQDALHGVASIILGELARPIQRRPFVAVDIAAVSLLGERAVREQSGVPSYRWGTIAMRGSDSTLPGAVAPTLAEWMALYPNPASAAATLEAGRLGPGDYVVELVDIDGTIHFQRGLLLDREQTVSSTLDLSEEPPGLYLVRIRRAGELVASYPVVVVR
jgi:hypothetical protein